MDEQNRETQRTPGNMGRPRAAPVRPSLDLLLRNLPGMVYRCLNDRFWTMEYVSEGARKLTGYPVEELLGAPYRFTDLIHPDDRARLRKEVRDAIEAGHPYQFTYRILTAGGDVKWVWEQGNALYNEAGGARSLEGYITDITDLRKAEDALRASEARFREQASLLDKAHDAIIVRDIEHTILFWNDGATRLYGWTAPEAVGKCARDLLYDDPAGFDTATTILLEQGEWRGEIRQRRKDGSALVAQSHWTLVQDDAGNPKSILSINTDITERKEAEDRIHRLAYYDTLTHLPNRPFLRDRLQHALAATARTRRRGALMFIDLDNFKTLNDTLGHDKGDMLLKQVAQRLKSGMRESDTVARFGGDEFVVLLEELSENAAEAAIQATHAGEKILAAFHQPYKLDDYLHYSSPSIGIALFIGHEDSMDEVLKHADLAMYEAKAAGRNAMRFFDPEMQDAVTRRAALEAELRRGSLGNEFCLHYQPLADAFGRITGVEALLRWCHPERGTVAPSEFIPLAEETGLILPLGHWVLGTACAQLATWAAHPDTAALTMSVNVSASQFHRPDFVEEVKAALKESGADPRKLKLELTESLLVSDIEETVAKMTALKAIGVGFSLDDFGTGYSSLSYLKRLPLDQLKIDQSFVRDVLTDANDATIARTIVALGQSLGLEVIAEGVETAAQQDFLAHHGCNAYQGFLFNRPLPIEEFDSFIRSRTRH